MELNGKWTSLYREEQLGAHERLVEYGRAAAQAELLRVQQEQAALVERRKRTNAEIQVLEGRCQQETA